MVSRTILSVAGCVTVASMLAACGGGAGASTGSSVDGTAATSLAGTPAATVQEVGNGTFTFSPVTVTVQVGQIVKWVDASGVGHNVTFSGAAAGLSSQTQSTPWEVKFTKAGTYAYKCTIHPGMVGTVIVN